MIIIFTLLIALIGLISATDYCKLCDNGTHTMCQFKEGPADTCVEYKKIEFTDSEKQYIVDIHNDIRNHVASGQESRGALGYQPAASDMFMLEWDDELAAIAQRWADQCVKINDTLQHDICKRTERFEVGQNILTAVTTDTDLPDLSTLILNWYKQVVNVIPSDVDHFVGVRRGKFLIGQYTQLVWGRTQFVGCGISVFKDSYIQNNDQYHHRLVCNYGPAGNIIGQLVYQRGVPCSRCPHGECDYQRVYLCRSHKSRQEEPEQLTTDKVISVDVDTVLPINTTVFTVSINTSLDNINTSLCLNPNEINITTGSNYTICVTGNDTNTRNIIPLVIVSSTSIQNETFTNLDNTSTVTELVNITELDTVTTIANITLVNLTTLVKITTLFNAALFNTTIVNKTLVNKICVNETLFNKTLVNVTGFADNETEIDVHYDELRVEPLIVNLTRTETQTVTDIESNISINYTSIPSIDIEEIEPLSIAVIEIATPLVNMSAVNLTYFTFDKSLTSVIKILTSTSVTIPSSEITDFMYKIDNTTAVASYSRMEKTQPETDKRIIHSGDDDCENRDRTFKIDNGIVLPHYCDKDCKSLKSFREYTRGRRLRSRKLFPRVSRQRDEIILPNNLRFKRARGSWHNGHCRCDRTFRSSSAKLKLTSVLFMLLLFL